MEVGKARGIVPLALLRDRSPGILRLCVHLVYYKGSALRLPPVTTEYQRVVLGQGESDSIWPQLTGGPHHTSPAVLVPAKVVMPLCNREMFLVNKNKKVERLAVQHTESIFLPPFMRGGSFQEGWAVSAASGDVIAFENR